MSLKSQRAGKDFENVLADSYLTYYELGVACLATMPLPTRPMGTSKGVPVYVVVGKAPFDIYGFLLRDGRYVGAEAKHSERAASLPIVAPSGKGDGLQYHQLQALAEVAKAGGKARVIWDNGGEYGVLANEHILNAFRIYEQVLEGGGRGKDVRPGAKSIKWELFQTIDYIAVKGRPLLDWLLWYENPLGD